MIDTLKQVLDAFETMPFQNSEKVSNAAANIRTLIAQLEKQEPVAYWSEMYQCYSFYQKYCDSIPLYTYTSPAVPDGWLRAVDEALTSSHLDVANNDDTYEEAKRKLGMLIEWNIAVATDPKVNGGWKLVPIEPTVGMLFAGGNNRESGEDFEAYRPSECAAIYIDMLNAAPEYKGE